MHIAEKISIIPNCQMESAEVIKHFKFHTSIKNVMLASIKILKMLQYKARNI